MGKHPGKHRLDSGSSAEAAQALERLAVPVKMAAPGTAGRAFCLAWRVELHERLNASSGKSFGRKHLSLTVSFGAPLANQSPNGAAGAPVWQPMYPHGPAY